MIAGTTNYACSTACLSSQFKNGTICVASCPTTAKYIQTDGVTCGAACSTGFFSYNATLKAPICQATCAFPRTKIINSTYNNYSQCELTCSAINGIAGQFLTYNQTCISTCVYQNQTNTSQFVCETNGTVPSTNCKFQTKIANTTNFVCSAACVAPYVANGTQCVSSTNCASEGSAFSFVVFAEGCGTGAAIVLVVVLIIVAALRQRKGTKKVVAEVKREQVVQEHYTV